MASGLGFGSFETERIFKMEALIYSDLASALGFAVLVIVVAIVMITGGEDI